MSEELKKIVGKTIDLLKPIVNNERILQEKYFLRPPFSFLQRLIDIIVSKTGFAKGLYTAEELKMKDAVEYLYVSSISLHWIFSTHSQSSCRIVISRNYFLTR